MLKYFIKKLLAIIPMLFVISILVFFAMRLMPGDPVNYLATPDMAANSANLAELRQKLGLNDPIYLQYIHWIVNMFHGDFGYSIISGTPIITLLAMKLPATLELSFAALIISTIFGIGLGLLAAVRQNSPADYTGRIISVLGTAIPQFFFGIIIIRIFAIALGWFPSSGRIQYGDTSFIGQLHSLILPALAMAIPLIAALLRYTRNSMLDVMNKDYVKTARSKGIPEWKVYIKHAFRNALGPTLVILMFRLPLLIGGSVVIETVFAWPGIGVTILGAVTSADYPVIMVTTLIIAIVILCSSFLVDVITALLDPRVRMDK